MTSQLAKTEATTDDIDSGSQAEGIKEQVQREMGTIHEEAAEAKKAEELKMLGKRQRLDVQEQELKTEIAEMEQRTDEIEQESALERQTAGDRLHLETQKAREAEQEKLEEQAQKMENKAQSIESDLNDIKT